NSVTKNLYNGTRFVLIEYVLKNGKTVESKIYQSKHFIFKIDLKTLSVDFYRSTSGIVRMKVNSIWAENENTYDKRKLLVLDNYPQYMKNPINNRQIIFESMWGTKYSCNPQHLYEYIDKNYPEFECIWSLCDERTPIKGKGKRIRRGSQEYYKYLATAKYFINNVNFEELYEKRSGQIEVQTMHGTPLKTLGLDVDSDFPTELSRQKFCRKIHRWDYLIVQGQFMKDKASDCYDFNKEYLCTGYPRTDMLFGKTDDDIKKIKEKLGIPINKKIILYTPTWRKKNSFDMQLDLERMRNALSDEYVLLVRLHHLSVGKYTVPADNEFIFDFTFYQVVEELYLASDILITDYSSVMFDYALLGKPMIFYTYDFDDYADKLRGLYVDFKKEAPGPLVYDTDEVINAVLNIDEETAKCSRRIEDFNNKYLSYENGNSCEQIVQTVFGSEIKKIERERKFKRVKKKISKLIK
ncbi:MAG: CDP-glycerol glycerophosphotransferase family protein, partial [Clostridiales bacterium]|nr:CDP-glycerol glycerophosphotransferase family protein [Clostridiales bacterium]